MTVFRLVVFSRPCSAHWPSTSSSPTSLHPLSNFLVTPSFPKVVWRLSPTHPRWRLNLIWFCTCHNDYHWSDYYSLSVISSRIEFVTIGKQHLTFRLRTSSETFLWSLMKPSGETSDVAQGKGPQNFIVSRYNVITVVTCDWPSWSVITTSLKWCHGESLWNTLFCVQACQERHLVTQTLNILWALLDRHLGRRGITSISTRSSTTDPSLAQLSQFAVESRRPTSPSTGSGAGVEFVTHLVVFALIWGLGGSLNSHR